MISATEILARSTLLVDDHLAASVPSVDIAQSFADTTVGVILDGELLRHQPLVVALETLRVLLAGMCIGIRLEVRGSGQAPRLGPPFGSPNWLDGLMSYRVGASAPIQVGKVDRCCSIRIGLGVAGGGVDFEMAADKTGCWLRYSGAAPRWEAANIWSGAGAAILAAAEIEKRVLDRLGEHVRRDTDLVQVQDFVLNVGTAQSGSPIRRIAVISAGAITNAAIFLLARCGIEIELEVWDDDVVKADNLNRYPLFDVADLGMAKVDALAALDLGPVSIRPVKRLFDSESMLVADTVLVGADRVEPRWEIARRSPSVAVIGSTDHYLTLTSLHPRGLGGCPACLHARDDGVNAVIPTISFVSFAAGLEAAAFLLRSGYPESRYQLTRTWLRPDVELSRRAGAIPRNPRCPVSCSA